MKASSPALGSPPPCSTYIELEDFDQEEMSAFYKEKAVPYFTGIFKVSYTFNSKGLGREVE